MSPPRRKNQKRSYKSITLICLSFLGKEAIPDDERDEDEHPTLVLVQRRKQAKK